MDQRLKDLEDQLAAGYKSTQNDGWYCLQPDCVYGVHGVANYMSRTRCNGCYKPRPVAERPPPQPQARHAQGQLQGTSEQAAKDKEAKKREARSKKRAERAAAMIAWKETRKTKQNKNT